MFEFRTETPTVETRLTRLSFELIGKGKTMRKKNIDRANNRAERRNVSPNAGKNLRQINDCSAARNEAYFAQRAIPSCTCGEHRR